MREIHTLLDINHKTIVSPTLEQQCHQKLNKSMQIYQPIGPFNQIKQRPPRHEAQKVKLQGNRGIILSKPKMIAPQKAPRSKSKDQLQTKMLLKKEKRNSANEPSNQTLAKELISKIDKQIGAQTLSVIQKRRESAKDNELKISNGFQNSKSN